MKACRVLFVFLLLLELFICFRLLSSYSNLPSKQTDNYLTSTFEGFKLAGIGNQVFWLVSIIGIAQKLGRIPYIDVMDKELLSVISAKIYPKYPKLIEQFKFTTNKNELVEVDFNRIICCRYEDVGKLEKVENEYLRLNGDWFQSHKYFDQLTNSIRQWLAPDKKVLEQAANLLSSQDQNKKTVCVHTRRGDFEASSKHKPSDGNFTRIAALKLRKQLERQHNKNTLIVVMGNDANWSRNVFKDLPEVRILEKTTPGEDWAFSGLYCDVVLITAPASTFGWWLGYLAKPGAAVYVNDIHMTGDEVQNDLNVEDFYPKAWKIVSASPNGTWRAIKRRTILENFRS